MALNIMENDMELVIMGKSGNGKSGTANTILSRRVFFTSSDANTDLWLTQFAFTKYEKNVVRVVEAPGMCHTEKGDGHTSKEVCHEFSRVIYLCDKGIDAMLLVIQFGNRFTMEDRRVIRTVRKLFGSKFMEERVILVFTHGEQFDLENENKGTYLTFMDWINRQTGQLKDLIEECQHRCVLFRNLTDDDEVMEDQRTQLFTIVTHIQRTMGGKRYDFRDHLNRKDSASKATAPERLITSYNPRQKKNIGLLEDSLHEAKKTLTLNKFDELPEKMDQVHADIEAVQDNDIPRGSSFYKTLENMKKDMKKTDRSKMEKVLNNCIEQTQLLLSKQVETMAEISEQLADLTEMLKTSALQNGDDEDIE